MSCTVHTALVSGMEFLTDFLSIAEIRKKHNEAHNKSQHSNFLNANLHNRKPSQLDEETRKKYLELLESKRQSLNYNTGGSQLPGGQKQKAIKK